MSSSGDSAFSIHGSSPPSTGPPSPPAVSTTPISELKEALYSKSSKAVLEHCLGISKLSDVPESADNMIVVCFDTESWVRDHDRLTELGIATFDSRDMRTVPKPGMHGEELLKQIYFYHARIQENAHLINIKYCVGDPTANRFGQTRFLSSSDACNMLDDVFRWPVDRNTPELGNCPVVVLGHALNNDFPALSNALGVRATVFENVVRTIDTQDLCVSTGFWSSRNQAGLSSLVNMSSFEYRDPHTACNDAAMTLFCAIQMVLPKSLKLAANAGARSLQDIVDEIEVSSKLVEWDFGTDKFCIRCGRTGHVDFVSKKKKCTVKVKCEHCAASENEKRQKASRSHVTKNCIFFAMRGPEGIASAEEIVAGLAGVSL